MEEYKIDYIKLNNSQKVKQTIKNYYYRFSFLTFPKSHYSTYLIRFIVGCPFHGKRKSRDVPQRKTRYFKASQHAP